MKEIGLFNSKSGFTSILMSFLLLGIILVAGCSSTTFKSTPQNKNISTIKTVLKKQFTGPDLKLVGLYESDENLTVVGKDEKVTQPKSPTKLEKYYEKMYRGYFTENMYSNFIRAYAFQYQFLAHNKGYQLTVDHIDVEKIEKTEGAYDFKVKVLYEKEGTEQKNAVVSGRVYFNKDGKITNIRYLDELELIKALKN
ncbi:hypothetical protein [Gottfriedia acidiceleris]|uniref:Lipoprotein n=1 Tax=Gottfriedia acidiceleris TaxID=371036 RepID=A0ABY4JLU1_9BACI|nr:hypothetical protein [Gottfriedia acidiceleris]UPM54807.1 hypothetical protein MY490_02740 [Gottfriedia acidiceleris]